MNVNKAKDIHKAYHGEDCPCEIEDTLKDDDESMTVFVYGSLKRGFYNHDLLENSRFVKTAKTTANYRLLDGGSYPFLIEDEDGREITGEIYEIPLRDFARIDRMETGAGYVAKMITLKNDESVVAYVYPETRWIDFALRDAGKTWKEKR